MVDKRESAREMSDVIRKKYTGIAKSEEEKYVDVAIKLISSIHEERNFSQLIYDATRTIQRLFGFNEVTIGLKSREDGKFRYEAIVGYTRDAEKTLRSFAYTKEQMCNCEEYPGVHISKYTEFNIREYETHKVGVEEKAFNRPLALRDLRPSPDQMIEGDYIDVYIYGEKEDMLGWIELASPRDGKFPSREALRWLEFFATLIGLEIRNQNILRTRR